MLDRGVRPITWNKICTLNYCSPVWKTPKKHVRKVCQLARITSYNVCYTKLLRRVNPGDPSLAYALDLGVRVPDYEVERRFWPDGHFEGGYLFRDTLIVQMVPPAKDGKSWLRNNFV